MDGSLSRATSSSAGDLPEAIKQHCEVSFETIQNRLEQKMVEMEARATDMMQKNAQALKQQAEVTAQTLQGSLLEASKENAQKTIQLAAQVDQLSKDAAQSHNTLDAQIKQVADHSNQRTMALEARFHKQEEAIQSIQQNFDGKLEEFGRSVLSQIAGLKSTIAKRPKPDSARSQHDDCDLVMIESDKQHRGGMKPFHVRRLSPQSDIKLESVRKHIAEACLECRAGSQSSQESVAVPLIPLQREPLQPIGQVDNHGCKRPRIEQRSSEESEPSGPLPTQSQITAETNPPCPSSSARKVQLRVCEKNIPEIQRERERC